MDVGTLEQWLWDVAFVVRGAPDTQDQQPGLMLNYLARL